MSHPAPAVILGVDSITGLQSARLLADRGIEVMGVARNGRHFASASRRLRAVVEASSDDLVGVLESFDAALGRPFVVIPCSDSWVSALAGSRPRWPHHVRSVSPEPDMIDTLMSKVGFSEFAARNGFAVPRTVVLADGEGIEGPIQELRFPLVVKPDRKPANWDAWMGGKVSVARDPAQLRSVVRRGLQRADSLIVQEWVEGGEDALLSFNGYFDRHSMPLAAFTARKLRQWPPGAGTSASGEEIRDDEIVDLAIELFQKASFRGLAYLEVKRRSSDGLPVLIEANVGRPTGRSAICEAGGVELVYSAYRDALGLPPLSDNRQLYRGVKWVYLRHEVQAAVSAMRGGELTGRQWLRSLRGRKVYAVWSVGDPLPFFVDIYHTVRKVLTRRRWGRASD